MRRSLATLVACAAALASPALSAQYSFLEAATLTASDSVAGRNDQFGLAVAISGDTLVIGKPAQAGGGTPGAVYVFEKPAAGWTSATEVARLTASDGVIGDALGRSVAIHGDTIVAAAPGAAIGGQTRRGAAYVFVKPSGGWISTTETAKLVAANGASGDQLGFASAVAGNTIVIGSAIVDVSGVTDQGAAYLFVKPAGGWVDSTETAVLTASDGAALDGFGFSAAASGDTVVIGSSGEDLGSGRPGGAYVFVEPVGGWTTTTETAKLTPSDGALGDLFGVSVAIDRGTIVVGADDADIGANPFQGAAYVFERPDSGWAESNETAKLTASDGATGDAFGFVAIRGDRVVVGAHSADVAGTMNQGAAYLYTRPAGGWINATESVKLTADDGASRDGFGFAVTITAGTVIVGAPKRGRPGNAYVFDAPISSLTCDSSLCVAGSRRLGGVTDMSMPSCSSATPMFVFGTPGAPMPIPGCAELLMCAPSCTPVVTFPGPTVQLIYPPDPSFLGFVFCLQGVCPEINGCPRFTNSLEITVSA